MTKAPKVQVAAPPPIETSYIINASKNVPVLLRVRDAILTIILWVAFSYMVRDFYYFAQDLFYWLKDSVSIKAYPKLGILRSLETYAVGLGVFAFAFVIWPIYNRMRFRKKNRRGFPKPVSSDDFSAMYGVPSTQILKWQAAREVEVHLDADGKLVRVDVV